MRNQVVIFAILLFSSCKTNSTDNYLLKNNLEDNLIQVATILNNDIPDYWYKISIEKGFNLNSNKNGIIGLNIYDLSIGKINDGNFLNNHVYHISPVNFEKSYSYIVFVLDNKIYIFKSINCDGKGDDFGDMMNFANSKFSENINPEIIDRLNNYRDYGEYIKVDTATTLNCES